MDSSVNEDLKTLAMVKEEFTASVDGSVDEDLDSLAVVEEADGHRGHASSAASVKLLGIEGGKYTVEGRMDSRVSPDTVFGLLVDYERVVDIFSNVLRSSTYRCAGADTRLQQVCRWEFLVFSGKFPLELTVAERPQQRQVVFSLDSSPFMDSFQGSWQVTPRAGGGSHIHHVMAVTPKLAPPRPLAFYTRRIFERQVAAILEDLAAALEKAC